MVEDTLRRLEERIRASKRTGEETRAELLSLVSALRSELSAAAETHGEDAMAVARHAEAVASGDAPPADGDEIEDALRGFETAHPRLVGLVQSFMRTLGDAGI